MTSKTKAFSFCFLQVLVGGPVWAACYNGEQCRIPANTPQLVGQLVDERTGAVIRPRVTADCKAAPSGLLQRTTQVTIGYYTDDSGIIKCGVYQYTDFSGNRQIYPDPNSRLPIPCGPEGIAANSATPRNCIEP
jgi:hypothetical protein